jgi:hypothetical protein
VIPTETEIEPGVFLSKGKVKPGDKMATEAAPAETVGTVAGGDDIADAVTMLMRIERQ